MNGMREIAAKRDAVIAKTLPPEEPAELIEAPTAESE